MSSKEHLAVAITNTLAPTLADVEDLFLFDGTVHFRLASDGSGGLTPRVFARYLADQLIAAGVVGGGPPCPPTG